MELHISAPPSDANANSKFPSQSEAQDSPAGPTPSSPIWSSSRSPSPTATGKSHADVHPAPRAIDGSEIPGLQRVHYTTGYRSGISDGRDDPSIAQRGFDSGFPLGAILGTRVGYLLEAVRHTTKERDDREWICKQAEKELSLEGLVKEMEASGLLKGARRVRDEAEAEAGVEVDAEVGGPQGKVEEEEVKEAEVEVYQADTAWLDSLPSMVKWTKFVEDAGGSARPG